METKAKPEKTSPRVFISYAHQPKEHEEAVRELWIFLRGCGIDAQLDLPAAEDRQDWQLWMLGQLRDADRVLVMASPAYRRRAEGLAAPDEGRGVQQEAALIREQLSRDRAKSLSRYLPVVLPGCSVDDIPAFLGPTSTTHYEVTDFSLEGAEKLLRVLTGQRLEVEPQLGTIPHLPPRSTERRLPLVRPGRHELMLDVRLEAGRLRSRAVLSGSLLGEHEAPLPTHLLGAWDALETRPKTGYVP
jgi:hypothetical protein